MSAEHTRTVLRFTRDKRFLAGVRGAVEHIGRRHDVIDEECTDVAAAAEQACHKALLQLDRGDSLCTVTIDEFEDHVEVSVENPGNSERGKLNSPAEGFATAGSDDGEAKIKKRLGRADFDASSGRVRTTLVKYFHKNPAHS